MNTYYVNVPSGMGRVDFLHETDTVDTVIEVLMYMAPTLAYYDTFNLRNEGGFVLPIAIYV